MEYTKGIDFVWMGACGANTYPVRTEVMVCCIFRLTDLKKGTKFTNSAWQFYDFTPEHIWVFFFLKGYARMFRGNSCKNNQISISHEKEKTFLKQK